MRVLAREALQKGNILGGKQDGSREFISLLATIYADGSYMPPALLYQGKSHDLQTTSVENIGEAIVHFACTEKGWTTHEISLQWVETIFDRYTKKKKRDKRLLIVDGNASHVNMAFFLNMPLKTRFSYWSSSLILHIVCSL